MNLVHRRTRVFRTKMSKVPKGQLISDAANRALTLGLQFNNKTTKNSSIAYSSTNGGALSFSSALSPPNDVVVVPRFLTIQS